MGLVIGASGGASVQSSSSRKSLLAPYNPSLINGVVTNLGNFIYGVRVEAGMSGTLRDLTVFIGAASGNIRVGVYDTGEASAGNRTLLYGSGSVVAAGAAVYQVVADPALAVTAGRQYDLVVFPDNNTVSFGRVVLAGVGANALPASFLPVTGAAPGKLNWAFNLAYAALPATISEANAATANASSSLWIGGRIV